LDETVGVYLTKKPLSDGITDYKKEEAIRKAMVISASIGSIVAKMRNVQSDVINSLNKVHTFL
jgi:hypothetical protein